MQLAKWLKYNWPIPAAFFIWIFVSAYAWWVINPNSREFRTEWLKASAQSGAALFLAMGLVYTHRTVENSRKTLDHQRQIQRDNFVQQEKSNQDDRFFRAAELLSNQESMDARIGALYALERLANESDSHYYEVIELICTFIRRRSEECRPTPDELESLNPAVLPRAPHDIDVAISVLGRRRYRLGDGEHASLDLREANLCGLYLEDADLAGARLGGSLLIGTHFLRGNLSKVNFINADFRYAYFDRVMMVGSVLVGGRGEGARFDYQRPLPDPEYLIPKDGGSTERRVWTRSPSAIRPEVNGLHYLDETIWGNTKLQGADLYTTPSAVAGHLVFRSDILGVQHVLLAMESIIEGNKSYLQQ